MNNVNTAWISSRASMLASCWDTVLRRLRMSWRISLRLSLPSRGGARSFAPLGCCLGGAAFGDEGGGAVLAWEGGGVLGWDEGVVLGWDKGVVLAWDGGGVLGDWGGSLGDEGGILVLDGGGVASTYGRGGGGVGIE